MLATLNDERPAWTMKTPLKVFIYVHEIAGLSADGTRIPLNPTEIWTTRRGREMSIKEWGQQDGGSEN